VGHHGTGSYNLKCDATVPVAKSELSDLVIGMFVDRYTSCKPVTSSYGLCSYAVLLTSRTRITTADTENSNSL